MIIDQLPTISLPVQDTDELPIERGQLTYKATVDNLTQPLKTVLNSKANTDASNISSAQTWREALGIQDLYQWNSGFTGTTKAQILSEVDALVSYSGVRFGYLGASIASVLGLPTAHFFIFLANSTNYRVLLAFANTGDRFRMLEKVNGTWASSWKSINLS